MRGTKMFGLVMVWLVGLPVWAHPGHDVEPDGAAADAPDGLIYVLAREPVKNKVEIEVRGSYRYITANGIPVHKTGDFPTRGNPNEIREQSYKYRVPVKPTAAKKPINAYGQPFGVAINGVPFDPGTAEIWTKRGRTHARGGEAHGGDHWNYDALSGKINLGIDLSNAHVQPSGAYHYHGIPKGLVKRLIKDSDGPTMTLVGYAADGFPIYSQLAYQDADDAASKLVEMKPSYRLKKGKRPGGDDAPGGKFDGTFIQDFEYVKGLGDLDECNGRVGVTPQYPEGTYYYVLTDTYPFIPRAYKGKPDTSFERRRGRGRDRGGDGGDRRRPPPPREGDRPGR